MGGRPEPRRGPGRERVVENTDFLDQFKMGRENTLDKQKPVGPEVRGRELVAGDLFIDLDGKMYRVRDIDDKNVQAVAVVGNGTLRAGRKSSWAWMTQFALSIRSVGE